jgi:hypothetical protein
MPFASAAIRYEALPSFLGAADGLAVDGDHQPTADLHGPGVQVRHP